MQQANEISPILSDLEGDTPCVRWSGNILTIPRLSMRGTFRVVRMLRGGISDLLDAIQGMAPEEDDLELELLTPEELETEAALLGTAPRQKFEKEVRGKLKVHFEKFVEILMNNEEAFYNLIVELVRKDGERADMDWIADNVPPGIGIQVVSIVLEKEFATDFFEAYERLQTSWTKAKTTQSGQTSQLETPSNGSTQSPLNSEPNFTTPPVS